jgi:hypothetical protein
MSTSQRTFDQVRSILGKLDRDIDAARQKRLQTRLPQAAPVGAPPMPIAAALAAPRPLNGASVFGRATPMRMEHRTLPAK